MPSDTRHESVRTCVGCRQRAAKRELLRVVADDGGPGLRVLPDPAGRAPGRGAHLHPTAACLELALRRRALPRALRLTGDQGRVTTTELEAFVQQEQDIRDRPDRSGSSSS